MNLRKPDNLFYHRVHGVSKILAAKHSLSDKRDTPLNVHHCDLLVHIAASLLLWPFRQAGWRTHPECERSSCMERGRPTIHPAIHSGARRVQVAVEELGRHV